MKKVFIVISILIGFLSCTAQNPTGVWMSYNNREFIHDSLNAVTTGSEGFFIDFDQHRFGQIGADSTAAIKIDFKKKSFATIYHKGFEVPFNSITKDSIEIDMGENVMHVFRSLDLSNEIKIKELEIESFLVENEIDSIQGYKFDFTTEHYFIDKMLDKPHKKNNVYNKNWKDCGYWFVEIIKGNAFLVLAIGQTERKNIFQILSIDKSKMKLKHLQNDRNLKGLTEIKTSL